MTRLPLALGVVMLLTAALYGFDVIPRFLAVLVLAGGLLAFAVHSFEMTRRR